VDNVRLDFLDFFAGGADAALEQRFHPADFGDDEAVKKNVRRDFFRRPDRLADAGNNVHFDFGNHRQPLQQRGGRGAEMRLRVRVVLVRLAIVGGQNDDAHGELF